MKNFLIEIICGILFCIALVGGIYKYLVLPEQKEKRLIKQKCETICFIENSQDNYFKCCIDCYKWESSK